MIALLMIKKMKNNKSEVKNTECEVKNEVKRNYGLAPKMALKVIPRRTRALMR